MLSSSRLRLLLTLFAIEKKREKNLLLPLNLLNCIMEIKETFWTLGKTVKINGVKYRSLINGQGQPFMTLKAKNALWVVDGYNARLRNRMEREAIEREERERETLAYGEAVMTAMTVW